MASSLGTTNSPANRSRSLSRCAGHCHAFSRVFCTPCVPTMASKSVSFLGFEPPHVHVQRFWNPVEFGGIFRVANIPCVNWFTNVTQPGLVHVKNAPKKLIDLGVEFAPME
ncbi:uncharacterized protein LOC131078580 isoform X2 [Cryptomeria japonica]|uniref:uncharacterized protein LOC131078580 isoform X2 n=1 Tax=Cryptomeria japonica TaxID=3369 RepID=UPI0025ACCDFE|nr:uncharacterized protein LOC131078580 isoform X2 [Cryptomeria japonica]